MFSTATPEEPLFCGHGDSPDVAGVGVAGRVVVSDQCRVLLLDEHPLVTIAADQPRAGLGPCVLAARRTGVFDLVLGVLLGFVACSLGGIPVFSRRALGLPAQHKAARDHRLGVDGESSSRIDVVIHPLPGLLASWLAIRARYQADGDHLCRPLLVVVAAAARRAKMVLPGYPPCG